ncbi:MAG: glycosyltransferase family 2 protein [Bacteroidota bacterium]
MPEVSIVIPLYNEEAVLDALIKRLKDVILGLNFSVEVVLVNDGSTDKSARLIEELAFRDSLFHSVFLSKNYGHQIAISAGMACAHGTKAVMLMDGDLQDPPELIQQFYDKINEGYDVAYAIRKKRKESLVKRSSYWLYYRLQRLLTKSDIPVDSGDFSMMSRRVIDSINAMPEKSRFVRGLRSWVGFRQVGIEYERDHRSAGETKYSVSKLFKLAYDGIFNFSNLPLKLITRLGLVTIIVALIYIVFLLVRKFVYGDLPQGYLTIIAAIALFSGVQLISLGVIGEYVSRTYEQVKERPLFLIEKQIINREEVG